MEQHEALGVLQRAYECRKHYHNAFEMWLARVSDCRKANPCIQCDTMELPEYEAYSYWLKQANQVPLKEACEVMGWAWQESIKFPTLREASKALDNVEIEDEEAHQKTLENRAFDLEAERDYYVLSSKRIRIAQYIGDIHERMRQELKWDGKFLWVSNGLWCEDYLQSMGARKLRVKTYEDAKAKLESNLVLIVACPETYLKNSRLVLAPDDKEMDDILQEQQDYGVREHSAFPFCQFWTVCKSWFEGVLAKSMAEEVK